MSSRLSLVFPLLAYVSRPAVVGQPVSAAACSRAAREANGALAWVAVTCHAGVSERRIDRHEGV